MHSEKSKELLLLGFSKLTTINSCDSFPYMVYTNFILISEVHLLILN